MPKYGFELEFAAPRGKRSIIDQNLPNGFVCGTDVSANKKDNQGLELRSAIFRQGLPRQKLAKCIKIIKQNEGFVHPVCGFHVHFSGFGEINMLKVVEFFNNMKNTNWRSRSSYCRSEWGKYQIIRKLEGDHYEIRIFNSSLKMRAICHYYALTRKAIRYASNSCESVRI